MRNATLLMLAVAGWLLPPTLLAQQEVADRGDFILQFHAGETEDESLLRSFLMSDSELQDLIDDINSEINLTRNVDIVFAPGNLIAQHWNLSPDDTTLAGYKDGQILYSYGKVAETMNLFRKNDDFNDTAEEFVEKILPIIETTILHEIGHALIHVNGIPIGPNENEEVVADQLAFFLVSDFYDAPEDFMPVVIHYAYRANDMDRAVAASSPHPQDEARANNYMCWMYGYDPATFGVLAQYIPYSAEHCEDAYYALWEDWEDRLDPSWKESAEPDPEELFYHLIDDEDYTLDAAIIEVGELYDTSVAVDLAVYLCSPAPDPECENSAVLQIWNAFIGQIEAGATVTGAVSTLYEAQYNPAILTGIAVYWCSPEPGPGCEEADVFTSAWIAFDAITDAGRSPSAAISYLSKNSDPFIAELIGVFVCGHPTCYEGEVLPVQVAHVEQPPLRPSGLKRELPKRRSSRPSVRSARE